MTNSSLSNRITDKIPQISLWDLLLYGCHASEAGDIGLYAFLFVTAEAERDFILGIKRILLFGVLDVFVYQSG